MDRPVLPQVPLRESLNSCLPAHPARDPRVSRQSYVTSTVCEDVQRVSRWSRGGSVDKLVLPFHRHFPYYGDPSCPPPYPLLATNPSSLACE